MSGGFEHTESPWLEIVSDEDLAFWARIEENLAPQVADGLRELYCRYVESAWRTGLIYCGLEPFMNHVMTAGLRAFNDCVGNAELQVRRELRDHLERAGLHG